MSSSKPSSQDVATTDESTGEPVSAERPTDEALANLDSITAVRNLMGPEAINAADLGSGFALLKDGDILVGTPCIFLFWEEHQGDFSDTFVSAHVVTFDPADGKITGKYIYNDGSSGVRAQLLSIGLDKRNLFAKHGLRKSEYRYCEECQEVSKGTEHDGHKVIPAATYYIDTAA